jgi:UDP-glucose 4-epimerase
MRILITGASGFIGSHLVRHLSGSHEVVALLRRQPDQPVAGVRYVEQDLSQPLNLTRLPETLDAVIHQAALIQTADQPDGLAFAVNVVATWALLQYAHKAGVRTFVYASSGGVYGARNRPFVEDDPFNPMNLYSLTKAQAELAVNAAPGAFHKVILRYFFPYGSGTPNPIPRWVKGALSGEPLQVLRSGKPAINPIHISDAVEATVRALHLEQSVVLNIAGQETTTFGAIAEMAARIANRTPNFAPIADEVALPYYRADILADTTAMQRLLNFQPTVDLATGIGALTRDYLNQSTAPG